MLYSTLETLFRHRLRYLVLLVILPLIGAAVCIPLYPKSTASESVWVQTQNLLSGSQPVYETYLTPAQVTQSDFEQYIQTQAFGSGVDKQLLHRGISPAQAHSIADGLSTGLLATATGNNLLLLTYSCTQSSLCPLVLSLSWQVYEADSAAGVNSQLLIAEQADQQQVQQAQQQLNQANDALNTYLAQHPGENQQSATDPTLSSLLQAVTDDQQALQSAQGKLGDVQAQASTNQISISSLYEVVDPPHTVGGHLSHLPTKQMMIAAALFWALAAVSLIVTARVARVVRHPNQLGATLGIQVAAVMQPIPAPHSTLSLPRPSPGAPS